MKSFDLDDKDGELQKERQSILNKMLKDFQNEFYYTSTIEIANLLHKKIHQDNSLSRQNFELIKDLSPDDIQILLSFEL